LAAGADVSIAGYASPVGSWVLGWGADDHGECFECPANPAQIQAAEAAFISHPIILELAFEGSRGIAVLAPPTNTDSERTRGRFPDVFVWGDLTPELTRIPSGLRDQWISEVASGTGHYVALGADGVVYCWGSNQFGQCSWPSDAMPSSRIAAGGNVSAALSYTGVLTVWGDNTFGQCEPPPRLSSLRTLDCGGTHVVAVNTVGAVIAWGDDSAGQCSGTRVDAGAIAVAAGARHTLVLRSDGRVVAFGANEHGQCEVPDWSADNPAIAVAAGDRHSLAMARDGSVIAWGAADEGAGRLPPELSGPAEGRIESAAGTPLPAVEAAAMRVTASEVSPEATWYSVIEREPDRTIVVDPALRRDIVSSGYPWRVRDNASGTEMLLVPRGVFGMGCIQPSTEFSCSGVEQSVRLVTIRRPFYLGRYEVSQAEWRRLMGTNPSRFTADPDLPVEQVSRMSIEAYLEATGLRLPTDEEWEFACRAGTTTPFHSGPGFPSGTTTDHLLGEIAWYVGNNGAKSMPVGERAPNAFGFHDMLGNVAEWCSGSSRNRFPEAAFALDSTHVVRGGSWLANSRETRSSARATRGPEHEASDVGFRVARNP
jgi:formylglycine-generating enzyme required for sulfatase activity